MYFEKCKCIFMYRTEDWKVLHQNVNIKSYIYDWIGRFLHFVCIFTRFQISHNEHIYFKNFLNNKYYLVKKM